MPTPNPSRRSHPACRILALLLTLSTLLLMAACGGDEAEDVVAVDAAEELDTGYDATMILERLTSESVFGDPAQLETLAADLNALKDSRDFHTARRQAKNLSVDFRNQPMRASMAAALMDLWNAKPPSDVTVADLEQAWAIKRERKKTEEEIAREREARLENRQAKQTEVDAQRVVEEQAREQAKVDVMAEWISSYQAATSEGRSALTRVTNSLTDPTKKDDLGPGCRDLFQATQTMDGRAFRAPDRDIEQHLIKAWERFRTASRSCMKGEMAYLSTQIAEGQGAVKRVNEILAKYGKTL